MFRNNEDIDHIIIHCADTPNGTHYDIVTIDDWHRERGFSRTPEARKMHREDLTSVGYHAVVYVDGAVALGRGVLEVGAHARGWNTRSLGVCLIGRDAYTPLAWDALDTLVSEWRDLYPVMSIIGHNEISEKTCPGFDVGVWIDGGRKALSEHTCKMKGSKGNGAI